SVRALGALQRSATRRDRRPAGAPARLHDRRRIPRSLVVSGSRGRDAGRAGGWPRRPRGGRRSAYRQCGPPRARGDRAHGRASPPRPTGLIESRAMAELGLGGGALDGLALHYVGAGRGPAVVLLHGLGGFAESWRRTVEALAPRHTVIALDLPGFGQSAKPSAHY